MNHARCCLRHQIPDQFPKAGQLEAINVPIDTIIAARPTRRPAIKSFADDAYLWPYPVVKRLFYECKHESDLADSLDVSFVSSDGRSALTIGLTK